MKAGGVRTAFALATILVGLILTALPRPAESAETYTNLAALTAAYGEPPLATYGRLRIAAIGVDAPIGAHSSGPDSVMEMPYGPGDVAWYDLRDYPGLGGAPGAGGNAIFAGHVNYSARVPYAGVRYRGNGVFADLASLEPGDIIEVTRQGETYRYAVTWKRSLNAETADWASVWSANVPIDAITLYTCGGTWDAAAVSYSDRVVVRAERVLGKANRLDPNTGQRFAFGLAGTSHPVVLAAAQRYSVQAIYGLDPVTEDWLVYHPGAPDFVNTLLGRMRPDWFVIIQGPPP